VSTITENDVHTINLVKEIEIAAPIDIAWEAVLDELGPESQMPGGKPFPFKLEAWPGGRWFRDLGPGSGHLWGHVQVIRPPALIEICGPMFMSYPATNFVQYRLTPLEGGGGQRTKLKLTHRAMGLIPHDDREGVEQGWAYGLERIIELAGRRMAAQR
jgi:uncharacterized protein YndB with AHSA1/START domain